MKRNIIPRICSLKLENDIAYGYKTNLPLSKGHMPTFSLNKRAKERNGQFYLPAPITINGTTVFPSARYRGKDATITDWPTWQYGEALNIFGSGNDPTPNNGSPLLGTNDDSVLFNAGKSYQGSNNNYLDVGTKDFIIECVINPRYITSSFQQFFSNILSNLGYSVVSITSSSIRLTLGDGTNTKYSDCAINDNSIFYLFIIVDRSGYQRIYLNNVIKDTDDITSIIGSISNSAIKFTIGSNVVGSGGYLRGAIEYFSIYMQQDWLDTHEQDALVAERFSHLIMTYPQIANGTAVPITCTTMGTSTVSKDGTSYTVEKNWIPYDRVSDSAGNIIAGLRVPSGGVLYWKGDDGNLGGTGSEKQGSIHFRIWIEAQTVSSQIDVWELNDGGAAGDRIRIYIDTNNQITVEVVASGGTLRTATVTGDVADGYIHDIHVIWRTGLLKIYRDGVSGTAITAIIAADIPDELDRIQQSAGGPVVEDPEIWKIPYVKRDIVISYRDQKVLGFKPYFWFKFNESSGSDIFDASGNARNQTLVGSATNFWQPGKNGNCGYFDDTVPNYIDLPISYFDGTKGTWCCWIKANWSSMTPANSRLLGTDHSSGVNYEHRTLINGINFAWVVTNGTDYMYSNIYNIITYDNIFIHIGYTWSYLGSGNTTITPYLNGVKYESGVTNIAGPLINPDISFCIAQWSAQHLIAYVDDFMFFQRCLSDEEMLELYQAI